MILIDAIKQILSHDTIYIPPIDTIPPVDLAEVFLFPDAYTEYRLLVANPKSIGEFKKSIKTIMREDKNTLIRDGIIAGRDYTRRLDSYLFNRRAVLYFIKRLNKKIP